MEPEFEETVAIEDLLALERRFLAESRSGSVSRESQFQYSWGLIHSPYAQDVTRGVALLKELLPRGSREEQRDCCYGLALGHYRMRDYEEALGHLQRLLAAEPQNSQGLRLQGLIRERMRREGLLGAAIVGGVALGLAGLAGLVGVAIARARR